MWERACSRQQQRRVASKLALTKQVEPAPDLPRQRFLGNVRADENLRRPCGLPLFVALLVERVSERADVPLAADA